MDRIPVVDVRSLVRLDDVAATASAVDELARACEDWGFFQVVGHGVADSLIDRVWLDTRRFFAMSRDDKLAISRTGENPRGYYDRELTKRARDLKEVFDFAAVPHPELADDDPLNRADVDGWNRWPPGLPGFRSTMLEYFAACEALGHQILGGLTLAMGLRRDALFDHFGAGHTSFVRLNHYPLDDPLGAAEASEVAELGDMALHHHTDAGALTILLQDDVGGLQVKAGRSWTDVEPIEGAFVINVGDMMQVWSNDRFSAALHRVRPTRGRARYSIPFFFNPSYDTDYAPLRSDEAPRYRSINWGEFRRLRTAGDYADYGEEVQIQHYRIERSPDGAEPA